MIKAYTGLPGTGKTLGMIAEAVGRVRRDRVQVMSNMVGLKFPEAVYLEDLAALARVGRGLVLLDEASVCASSRYWQSVPRDVLAACAQSRHKGLDILFTSQHLARVDTVLRELCTEQIDCRRVGNLYVQVTTDPAAKVVLRRRVKRYPRWVFALYDTLEMIQSDGSGGGDPGYTEIARPSYAKRSGAYDGAMLDGQVFRVPVRRWYDRRGRLTEEAVEVVQWLAERERLNSGEGWLVGVADELARRRWLQVFDLTWRDVPDTCRYDACWAKGHSPLEVRRRSEESELEELVRRTRNGSGSDAYRVAGSVGNRRYSGRGNGGSGSSGR